MFVINNKFWQAIEYKECEKKTKRNTAHQVMINKNDTNLVRQGHQHSVKLLD